MKGEKELWDEIRKRYPELKTDDEIADEVLAHYSGKRGAERLREEQRKIAHGEGSVFDKAKAISALERVRQAINNFWHQVADFLHIHYTSAEQVADQAMKDLLEGVDPTKFATDNKVREQFIGEKGAKHLDTADDATTRMDNKSVAEEMEKAGIVERAKADGTYMKAPNGKQSKLDERQWVHVRTNAFKDFFGDWENDPENASKVVDENGEPLVVYHSGNAGINTFSRQYDKTGIGRQFWGGGYYFGTEKSKSEWSRRYEGKTGQKATEYACFLNIRNPKHSPIKGNIALSEYDGVILPPVNTTDGKTEPMFIVGQSNQIKSATDNVGTYDKRNDNILFRTSDELNDEYGDRWLTEQTNNDGRHSTQVKNTVNSYKKFGAWVKEDAKGRNVSVLDASSGLGLGTEALRNEGFAIDDVEPYPSSERPAPTFTNYADIDKQYDYVISNAVLNVIPSDWRANVLHDMADKLKVGGKMVINVRGAESIRKQGKEGVTRITLDDPSEILVLRPDGSIKAYQKGFTKQELKDWCEKELGEGYSVEIATKKNAGDSYDTAVVVTKNNESDTIGVASETGHPRGSAQAVSNAMANLRDNSDITKGLDKILATLSAQNEMTGREYLFELARAFGFKGNNFNLTFYKNLGRNLKFRISNHYANADNFNKVSGGQTDKENYGIVVKLSPHKFKDNEDVDYLEYVYFPDKLNGRRQADIVNGLKHFVQTGDFSQLPKPDKVNPSGKFKVELRRNGTPELVDNGYLPEWQRAGRDTPQFMIEASKWANENLGGGHRNRRGWIENNTGITFTPSILWHGLSGYGGGLLTFGMKAYNLGDNIFFGGEHEAKDLPFVGKFYVYSGDCPRSAFFLAFEKRRELPQAETEFIARHGTIVYGKEPLTLVHPMLELRRLGRRSGQNGPTLAYA